MVKVIIPPPELIGQPDVLAMLQAFYSRSHVSITDRLVEMTDDSYDIAKIRDSLKRYYVNYGHESIGDCGDVPVFIEGVSMLTAKAIQDNPLYNGQESSSRYIDFASQPRPRYADAIYDTWIELYSEAASRLTTELSASMTPQAAKVAAFDIARGLLPVGVQTQLSWKTSIRQLRGHLAELLNHPYHSVVGESAQIWHALTRYMPDMFRVLPDAKGYDWFLPTSVLSSKDRIPNTWARITPESDHLPIYGTATFYADLDYGSYRDIQRHRGAYIKSTPLHNHDGYGLNSWYLNNLPSDIAERALANYARCTPNQSAVTSMPLMANVRVAMTATANQLAYMIELRTKPSVHATARKFMQDIALTVLDRCPNMRDMFSVNYDVTDYARRSTQTILKDGVTIE